MCRCENVQICRLIERANMRICKCADVIDIQFITLSDHLQICISAHLHI